MSSRYHPGPHELGQNFLVDDSVVGVELAVVGSGVRRSKIALPGALLAQLPSAEVLALRM